MSDHAVIATGLLFLAGFMVTFFAAFELSHRERGSRGYRIAIACAILGVAHMLPGFMRLWITAVL